MTPQKPCEYVIVTEQKARTTYDNILRLSDDPDVNDVIKFLRAREIVHYQRFAERVQSRWNGCGATDDEYSKSRVCTENVYSALLVFDQ